MLIEFRVKNHRSIRDEQALTLEAGRVDPREDSVPRSVVGHKERLLPVAAVYGANASGKSNLLGALRFMREAVDLSHRSWEPEGGVPREPFAWGEATNTPSLYEVSVVVDGVRYEYGFVADGERFLEEWLFSWPHGRKRLLFERELDVFKFGEHLRGENETLVQFTRPNALFLSTAVQHRHEQLAPVHHWFAAIWTVNLLGRAPTGSERTLSSSGHAIDEVGGSILAAFFESNAPALQSQLLGHLLRAADVGIVDLKCSSDDGATPPHLRRAGRRVYIRHQSSIDEAWLPIEEESRGTLAVLRMAPALLSVMARGGLLVIDELESSLHPLLARAIVRTFNDPTTNPRHAQLLVGTHDTHLIGTTLDGPALRRDQIWLVEKDPEGATCLYPLTDYQPRKAENLERGYLQGRYGAIPFPGHLVPATPDSVR